MYNNCYTLFNVRLNGEDMSRDIQRTGRTRREKAVSMAMKRKEEYLGARVPKELRDRVIQRAKQMGIPVSILIRNILEEAFKEGQTGHAVVSSAAESNSIKSTTNKFSAVLGWEKLQLNKTVSCSSCGVDLQQGTEAFLGLGAAEPVVICNTCKRRL